MANLFNHAYPYLDEHELNLDWLIAKMKELNIKFDEFKVINQISYGGSWDITKQYTAWTIVDDGGMGYISIQPVPAGVDISNTDYWTLVADYSVVIAGLAGRVTDLENDMTDAQNDIDAIEDEIAAMKNRKFIFIGDSYNTTDMGGDAPITPWAPKLAQFLGLGLDDYWEIGQSGCGFVNGAQFINLLDTIDAVIPDKDAITDVVVLGGVNDSYLNFADVSTAMDDFITHATTLYPNCTITIGFISWSKSSTTRTKMAELIPYYESKAYAPNVRIISNGSKFFHNYLQLMQSDGHPNSVGTNAIARGIANILKGGTPSVHWFTPQEPITFDNALNITTGNGYITSRQYDDIITTKVELQTLRSSGFTIDTGTEFTFGTFTCTTAMFNNYLFPISMYMHSSSTMQYYMIDAIMRFRDDTISIIPLTTNSGGTFSITNIDFFRINNPIDFVTSIMEC